MNSLDRKLMLRAVRLAKRGEGYVEPNPMVGAVVARADGSIVGEGWHKKFGGPHAEVVALDNAGSDSVGATLYVTLEPCCHFGKTPPCTERILQAGIRKVVFAVRDPFPQVAGKGEQILREKGLEVDVGLCADEATELLAPYLKLVRSGKPFVISKWAMSADGKIATSSGESKWISSEESRKHSRQWRGRLDAILVGVQTVIADDPSLEAAKPIRRIPVRIVLDSELRIPLESRLVTTARKTPTMIAYSRPMAEKAAELTALGCEVLLLPAGGDGKVSIEHLLAELGKRRMTNVLVEGGEKIHGAFFEADAVDAVRCYIAPSILGGANAPGPVGGKGFQRLADSPVFRLTESKPIGDDLFIAYRRMFATEPHGQTNCVY